MTDINSTIIGGGGASTQSNSIDSKASVLSGYSLSTSAQTIVGAINEIEESLDNYLTKAESSKLFTPIQSPYSSSEYKSQIIDLNQDDPSVIGSKLNSGVYLFYDQDDIYTLRTGSWSDHYYWLYIDRVGPLGYYAYDIAMSSDKNITRRFYPFQGGPFDVNYYAPDSSFTGTTLINSSGISTVNIWELPFEYSSQSNIYLVNNSGGTTDKIKYSPVRVTKYQDFQTAHEGDKIRFDEIIQLSTIVTNSFAESDLFIYHARINNKPEKRYYLVDIVMTE